MTNGPFEDVFPIENGDIPASYVSSSEGSFSRVLFPILGEKHLHLQLTVGGTLDPRFSSEQQFRL